MKANENAAGAKKRSTQAFYPELAKGKGHWISYIYCRKLNLLLRNVNDLTTTIGVFRGKAKAGTLSKRLEKFHYIPNKASTLNYRTLVQGQRRSSKSQGD